MSQANKHNRHFGYKYSRFGEDGYGQEVTVYGDTTGKYSKWDYENDKAVIVGDQEITGDFTLTGSLKVTGNSTQTGDQAIKGDVTVTGGLTATGGFNYSLAALSATGGLDAGTPVYISGLSTGSVTEVSKAKATANPAMFIVTSGSTAAAGAVTVQGMCTITGVATSTWTTVGDPVYLGEGAISKDVPTAQNSKVQLLGYVTVKSTTGTVYLFPAISKPYTIAATT